MKKSPSVPSIPRSPARRAWTLFLLGFLTLYLELVLIRYMAGSIWNLGFFPNLVLLGAFVGMGVGFVCHHFLPAPRSRRIFEAVPPSLLLVVFFVATLHPTVPGFAERAGEVGGELFFTFTPQTRAEGGLASFLLWIVAVVVLFAMISQFTAKLFATFEPLRAYTLDIAGSCCGIVAFMALSWFQTPAGLWFLFFVVLFGLILVGSSWKPHMLAACSTLVATLLVFHQDRSLLSDTDYPGNVQVTWSPYQKIECTDGSQERGPTIYVNGIHHQGMRPLAWIEKSSYQAPYADRSSRPDLPPLKRVLIMGAGSGNDVAAALQNGVDHVDAVEIDPVIAEMGRLFHPARPYDDPRVHLTIDDARAFLTRSSESYDLIVFALTDSLIRVSPMAQLRLENYLFTRESITRAYQLLSDEGSLVFYNFYRRPWLVEKLRRGIHSATGIWPRQIHLAKDFVVMAADRNAKTSSGGNQPSENSSAGPQRSRRLDVDVTTDDWPFLYLQKHGVPAVYLAAMAVFAVLVGVLVTGMQFLANRRGHTREDLSGLATKLAFALMGVAFLLLETKSIIQFSLLFGTTWLNNSLVFLAILLLVLAANWTAQLVRGRWLLTVTVVALLASSLATLAYPLSNLLYVQNAIIRFAAASALTFSPIFFANLLFSLAFRDQATAEHLFGWNLLGATLGGILEYSSMALGYNALSVIVAVCYAVAFVLLLKDGVFGSKTPEVGKRDQVPQLVS